MHIPRSQKVGEGGNSLIFEKPGDSREIPWFVFPFFGASCFLFSDYSPILECSLRTTMFLRFPIFNILVHVRSIPRNIVSKIGIHGIIFVPQDIPLKPLKSDFWAEKMTCRSNCTQLAYFVHNWLIFPGNNLFGGTEWQIWILYEEPWGKTVPPKLQPEEYLFLNYFCTYPFLHISGLPVWFNIVYIFEM